MKAENMNTINASSTRPGSTKANPTKANQAIEAWLLECGSLRLLVSPNNIQHVIESTDKYFHVPMMPAHCNSMLVWQQHVMPVVNVAVWLNAASTSCQYSCIMGWQDIDRGNEYGVLMTSAFPQRVKISDSNCVTPSAEVAECWQQCALCFVQLGNDVIPIIDPARLFGASQFKEQQGHSIGMIA
jgi:chemotaxis signal transduction protein